MSFNVLYLDEVVSVHIPSLPKSIRKTIKTAIETRLTIDPIKLGKPLQYSHKGYRRLRVSDYRIIYTVEVQAQIVIIVSIKHRSVVYSN